MSVSTIGSRHIRYSLDWPNVERPPPVGFSASSCIWFSMTGVKTLTSANVDDRKPVPCLFRGLFGKLFGDRGYLSKSPFEQLFRSSRIQLSTKVRSTTENRLMMFSDKVLLRKRAIAETIIDQLKNIINAHFLFRAIAFLHRLPAGSSRCDPCAARCSC